MDKSTVVVWRRRTYSQLVSQLVRGHVENRCPPLPELCSAAYILRRGKSDVIHAQSLVWSLHPPVPGGAVPGGGAAVPGLGDGGAALAQLQLQQASSSEGMFMNNVIREWHRGQIEGRVIRNSRVLYERSQYLVFLHWPRLRRTGRVYSPGPARWRGGAPSRHMCSHNPPLGRICSRYRDTLPHIHTTRAGNEGPRSFQIMEKAHSRTFSWFQMSSFSFKNLSSNK